MYKRVMVGIDDNFANNQVLATALRMCRQVGARLAICHAIDQTLFAMQKPAHMMNASLEEVQARLRESALPFLEQAAAIARGQGVETETLLICSEEDDVAQMLVKAANEWHADLLVIGENASRGLERFFIDSVSESLLRTSNISLLVVHAQTPEQ